MTTEAKLNRAYELRVEAARKTQKLHDEVMRLEKEIERIRAPYEEQYEAIEKEVIQYALDTESKFECDVAKVGYRKGYSRSSWDTKALTKYAEEHEELKGMKKTSFVEPKASITWKLS